MKNKVIIAISGKAGAGKDYFASKFAKFYSDRHVSTESFAFADELKTMTSEITGIHRENFDERSFKSENLISKEFFVSALEGGIYKRSEVNVREFLIGLGTAIRSRVKDFFADIVCKKIEKSVAEIVIVTDLRYKNELQKLQEIPNTRLITVRIESDKCAQINDPSETELDEERFDFIIPNSPSERANNNIIASEMFKLAATRAALLHGGIFFDIENAVCFNTVWRKYNGAMVDLTLGDGGDSNLHKSFETAALGKLYLAYLADLDPFMDSQIAHFFRTPSAIREKVISHVGTLTSPTATTKSSKIISVSPKCKTLLIFSKDDVFEGYFDCL